MNKVILMQFLGKFIFENENHLENVLNLNLAPIKYVDEVGKPTECYPANPNGSPNGIAALCSPDGRHLAVMPHPERCFLKWQWPYWPAGKNQKNSNGYSPWMLLFENAYNWCVSR